MDSLCALNSQHGSMWEMALRQHASSGPRLEDVRRYQRGCESAASFCLVLPSPPFSGCGFLMLRHGRAPLLFAESVLLQDSQDRQPRKRKDG